MTLEFTVPGQPQGKQRPRFDSRNNRTYTPQKTVDYEKLVQHGYLCYCRGKKLTGAVAVDITANFKIPKSWSKTKHLDALNGNILPTVKPDYDNISKSITDALNGIAYIDDAYVTDSTFRKRYSETPGVTVKLSGEEART
jgi:Holliday junction resolvase RusA-like endonuclease